MVSSGTGATTVMCTKKHDRGGQTKTYGNRHSPPGVMVLIFVVGTWFVAATVQADGFPMGSNTAGRHMVGIFLGFDPTFTLGVSYTYVIRAFNRPIALEMAFSAPLALVPDGDHGTVQSGVGTLLAPESSGWNGWLQGGLDLTAGRTGVSRERSVGLYAAATPGYFTSRWYAGPTFRYEKTLVTHRSHTAWYRDVYPEVADGWYTNDSGYFVLGAAGGVSVANSLALDGFVGYKLSDDLRSYDPFVIPASAKISMYYRF